MQKGAAMEGAGQGRNESWIRKEGGGAASAFSPARAAKIRLVRAASIRKKGEGIDQISGAGTMEKQGHAHRETYLTTATAKAQIFPTFSSGFFSGPNGSERLPELVFKLPGESLPLAFVSVLDKF
jgi:hypothetical protein